MDLPALSACPPDLGQINSTQKVMGILAGQVMFDTNDWKVKGLVSEQGFLFVPAGRMRSMIERAGPLTDWMSFASSWNELDVDTFMADEGRYRLRRHAVFCSSGDGGLHRLPNQPHYQATDYNPLNGGIERYFTPISEEIGASVCMMTILTFCHRFFSALSHVIQPWRIEVHQFRIEAQADSVGNPTPEGMHRDGVDFVLVLLVNRFNIRSGTTMIEDHDRRPLGSFTLAAPLDAALVDDSRVLHGVTPVKAVDETKQAYRDVLVVTFQR